MHYSNNHTYQSLCTEFYELDKPTAPQKELEYYLARAEGAILEPMCGTGRFLVPLAEKGCDICGFDSSHAMLAVCRMKCKSANLLCDLQNASFYTYKTKKTFNRIFIPSGSFGLLNNPKDALEKIYSWLAPSGSFIFEIETAPSSEPQNCWKGRWKRHPDGSLIVLHTLGSYDEVASVETTLCRYELWKDNKVIQTEVEEFSLKIYTSSEIEELLENNGFRLIEKSSLDFAENVLRYEYGKSPSHN